MYLLTSHHPVVVPAVGLREGKEASFDPMDTKVEESLGKEGEAIPGAVPLYNRRVLDKESGNASEGYYTLIVSLFLSCYPERFQQYSSPSS